jgi:hypothetical protein
MSRLCASCKAEVVYVPTQASGGERYMPIDAEGGKPKPDENGNLLIDGGRVSVVDGLLLLEAQATGRDLFMPHWSTCPYADQHRKRG